MACLYSIDCFCGSDDTDIQHPSLFLPDALFPSYRSRRCVLSGIKNSLYHSQTTSIDGLRLRLFHLSGPLCVLLLFHRYRLLYPFRHLHTSLVNSLFSKSIVEDFHIDNHLSFHKICNECNENIKVSL